MAFFSIGDVVQRTVVMPFEKEGADNVILAVLPGAQLDVKWLTAQGKQVQQRMSARVLSDCAASLTLYNLYVKMRGIWKPSTMVTYGVSLWSWSKDEDELLSLLLAKGYDRIEAQDAIL